MRGRDVLAGALLVNAIPHTIIGLAGKRGMTPWGGPNSSPAANLVWAGLNVLSGLAALGPRSWRRIGQRAADQRLRAVTVGIAGMAAFAAAYQVSPAAAQHRRVRAALAPPPTAPPRALRAVRHGPAFRNPEPSLGKETSMTNTPGSGHLGRKLATAAAVAATGFVCGWSALGLTAGVVLAAALCAGVAVPLFHNHGKPCPPRHREPR